MTDTAIKVDPEAQKVLDAIDAQKREAPSPDRPPTEVERVQAVRKAYAGVVQMAGRPEPVAHVEDRVVDGPNGPIPVRIYGVPASARTTPVLVWFHGGSFIAGDLETHDAPLRAITNRSGFPTIAVAWRLAPEYPYPAGLEDGYAVLAWLRAAGASQLQIDPSRIAVGGDSAGGALAAALTQLSRDRGDHPPIAAQVLVYPNTDLAGSGSLYPSWTANDGRILERHEMEANFALYAGSADRMLPGISPLRGALHGLPKALIITAEADPQRDEGEAYGQRLRDAGVTVDTTRFDGMIHGFLQMGGVVRAAQTAINQIGLWLFTHA